MVTVMKRVRRGVTKSKPRGRDRDAGVGSVQPANNCGAGSLSMVVELAAAEAVAAH